MGIRNKGVEGGIRVQREDKGMERGIRVQREDKGMERGIRVQREGQRYRGCGKREKGD